MSANDRSTSTWPLALALACLVVYASLYPFSNWRDQGLSAWAFLSAPLPRYWTGFDVAVNVLGYSPLGFLLALAVMRGTDWGWPVTLASLGAALLSLSMEMLQGFLPSRVPSNLDLALNALGAWLGALAAYLLERLGALQRWGQFRRRWFIGQTRGPLVLLALWPPALLFPLTVPFGLGQVMQQLEEALGSALVGTPFLDWLPVREVELQPMLSGSVVLCVALGLLVPVLLGYAIVRWPWQKLVVLALACVLGVSSTALSSALSFGPEHAWAWLDGPVRLGLGLGLLAAALALLLPVRGAVALALLALGVQLTLLNQAAVDSNFEYTRQIWEQGRFVRFNGLTEWLGWLWPFAALVYALMRLSAPAARAGRNEL
jgi:VanZ family protein